MNIFRRSLLFLGVFGISFLLPVLTKAATIEVTTYDDVWGQDGVCSLREAILTANYNTDTIQGPQFAYELNCYPVGAYGNDVVSLPPVSADLSKIYTLTEGEIWINSLYGETITLQGQSGDNLNSVDPVVNAGGLSRFFSIKNGSDFTIENVQFQDGFSEKDGGAIFADVNALLTLSDVVFLNNVSQEKGGALYFAGTLLSSDTSTFSQNAAKDGGALYLDGGAVNFSKDSFIGNSASDEGGAFYNNSLSGGDVLFAGVTFDSNQSKYKGGALYNNGVISIQDSLFQANSAQFNNGGAVYNAGTLVSVQDTDFTSNSTLFIGDGGALYNENIGVVGDLKGSHFSNNKAKGHGGAIFLSFLASDQQIVFNDMTFQNNSAKKDGGALYLEGSNDLNDKGLLKLSNTQFLQNSAADGGAVFAQQVVSIDVDYSSFTKNIAQQNGGALSFGMLSQSGFENVVKNSSFVGNISQQGGAISLSNVFSLLLKNNTFAGNQAIGPAPSLGRGGALYGNWVSFRVINNTFVGNSAQTTGGGMYLMGAGYSVKLFNNLMVDNSNYDLYVPSGALAAVTMGGNIVESANPSSIYALPSDLVNPQNFNPLVSSQFDYSGLTPTLPLLVGSPAIDFGLMQGPAFAGFNCPSTDQRGMPRVGNCDVGAYEFQGQ